MSNGIILWKQWQLFPVKRNKLENKEINKILNLMIFLSCCKNKESRNKETIILHLTMQVIFLSYWPHYIALTLTLPLGSVYMGASFCSWKRKFISTYWTADQFQSIGKGRRTWQLHCTLQP